MAITRCVSLGIVLLLGLALFADSLPAQKKRTIQKKRTTASRERRTVESELAQLRREIRSTEAAIREHDRKENRSKQSVAAFDKRTRQLNASLGILRKQAASLQTELRELNVSYAETEESISDLKEGYARDAVKRYTRGVYRDETPNLSLLDDPNARTEQRRRAMMGRIATEGFTKNRNVLDSQQTELSEDIANVSASLSEEQRNIAQTNKEAADAQKSRQQEEKLLKQIQAKKQTLQKELNRRRADAKRLEGIINGLIAKEEAERKAKEEARKKRLAELKKKKAAGKKLTAKEKKQEKEDAKPAVMAAGPRSLSWPTASRKIAQGYGEVRNKELGTVTMNLGIDIAASEGSAVLAAADGTVSAISTLPSYGTILIINHSGGIYTVYADLDGVNVSRGAKVSRGQRIGSSGSNPELGGILHFEVWKGRAKQNPLGWLK